MILSRSCLKQQVLAVCESFARQRPVEFGVALDARWKSLGLAADPMRQIFPVDPGDIGVIGKPHGKVLSDA
jgi:hypothetical protein